MIGVDLCVVGVFVHIALIGGRVGRTTPSAEAPCIVEFMLFAN